MIILLKRMYLLVVYRNISYRNVITNPEFALLCSNNVEWKKKARDEMGNDRIF